MGEKLPTPVVHHIAMERSSQLDLNRHQSLQTLQERVLNDAVESTPHELPEPPFRPHLVFFHERKPVITRGRQITAFHTHIHLGALPDPLNHLWYLDHLIHQKVSPRVQKLLKTNSEGNRGMVIKPWNWDHHAFYNLKDYYSINTTRTLTLFWITKIQIWCSR